MDAIASISQRIAQIQTRIASVTPAAVRPQVVPQQPAGSAAAFAQALEEAVRAQPATASTAQSTAHGVLTPVGSATGLPTAATAGARLIDGVPADLAGYGNGKVPEGALTSLSMAAGHRLWAPAAAAFEQLYAAAARDGVTIGITDSYRSYEAQVALARRKGLYSQGGLAAVPGTSDHGWGRSLDLALDGPALAWMRANAGRFGFVEDVPREPWHWTFTP